MRRSDLNKWKQLLYPGLTVRRSQAAKNTEAVDWEVRKARAAVVNMQGGQREGLICGIVLSGF